MSSVSDDLVPFDFSRKLTALQRSLYAYILTLLPNRADAEDVLQEGQHLLARGGAVEVEERERTL